MQDLDHCLTMLREEPVSPRLAAIEGPVLAGFGARREAQVARRGIILASLVAVVVGTSAALVPGSPAEAAPLFAVPESAPSHLLGQ